MAGEAKPAVQLESNAFVIRHKHCNARLYDSKVDWQECSIRDALIVIKCWRCSKLLGYRPILPK